MKIKILLAFYILIRISSSRLVSASELILDQLEENPEKYFKLISCYERISGSLDKSDDIDPTGKLILDKEGGSYIPFLQESHRFLIEKEQIAFISAKSKTFTPWVRVEKLKPKRKPELLDKSFTSPQGQIYFHKPWIRKGRDISLVNAIVSNRKENAFGDYSMRIAIVESTGALSIKDFHSLQIGVFSGKAPKYVSALCDEN